MPRILENDAYSLAQSLETMDATQRAQALDILTRYRDQQSDLGEPQWPKQEKAAQDYTNRLRGMFKDIKTVDSVAPSLTAILPYSQNPDADRARVANTAYMAQRYGKTPEEISAAYDLYRNDYAQRFLQAPTGLDDLGFHKAAAQEIQKTELKEGAELDGIKAAFRGDDVVPALQAWQQKNTDRLPDSTEFRKGFLGAREWAGDQLEFADKLLKQIEGNIGLTKNNGEKVDKPSLPEAYAQFEESLATLADMKQKDRKKVYAIMGAKAEAAGYDLKGFWSQTLSYIGKGLDRATNTVTASGSDLLAGGSMVGGDAAGGFAPVPADAQERFQQGMEQRGKRSVVYAELANIVAGSVDPFRPTVSWINDTVEEGLVKGPGAVLPFMAASVALGPYGAGVLFTADFAEQNRRDLVISGMDEGQARVIGMAAAPLQAITESLSNALQLGRFPAVQKVLAGFTKPIGGGAGLITRYVQNSIISGVTEFTEEQLQDNVIVPAIQNIVAAFDEDVPSVGMGQMWDNIKESSPELFWTLAPMALVFGGTMTAAQANLSGAMTRNIDALKALNYSEAQAVEVVSQKTDEARIAKASSLWGSRAGDKVTLEQGANKLAERMKLLQTDHMAAQLELKRRGALPILTPLGDGKWRAIYPADGSTADFNSHQEADAARWQWAADQLGKVHVAVQRTLRQMERNASVGRAFALQFSPEERYATPEEMASKDFQDRVKQGELLDEVRPEQQYSDAVAIDKASGDDVATKILGSSVNTFKDGVLTTTMKLYHGADITTLVEEKLEGDAKAIMADPDGRQWMLEHMRSYENASGDKLFASDNDADITDKMLAEAWSHVGQSYLVGKSTNAKAWPARTARRMFSYVLNAGLSPVMNAETQYWRAVALRAQKLAELQKAGKLGEDLTAELERQLGIDSQTAHETAVADGVAREVASYSEENPGPNGETFSISSKELRTKIEASPDNTTLGNLGITEGFHANNAEGVIPDFAPRTSKQGRRGQYAGFYLGPSANEVRQYGNNVTTFPLNPATPVKVLRRPGQVERITPEQIAAWNAEGFGVVVGPAIMASRIEIATLNPGVLQGETFSTSRATPADASKQTVMPDGARLVGPTTFSIKAFHGTPHKVDKFTTAKIGTGEGAQAYGWGLYFAENREVGEEYRDKLAQWTLLTSDGKIYDDRKELKNLNVRAVLNKNGSVDEAIARARSVIESIPGTQGAELALADIETLEKLKASGGLTKTKGNLYTVELLPDADEFLDWDKPLSEQSEKVRKAVGPLIHSRDTVKEREAAFAEYDAGAIPKLELSKRLEEIPTRSIQQSDTGATIYQRLWSSQTANGREASEFLASIGIPGIRYLDGNSRDGGSGTSNFVIFDESLVKILEENGKPVGETFSLRKFPVPPGLAEAAQKARGESSLILAYQAAQRGSSSAMVPIRSVYEQAKKYQPALTPAQFMAEVNALNDSGKILVGLSETMKAVEAAGEFRVGGAGTEMAFAPQETFSVRVTPAQDADYLAAVQAGDMEKAQRMVDKAAKAAGYDVKAWHVTNQRFTKFNPKKAAMGGVFWFTTDRGSIERDETGAGLYPGKQKIVMPVFLFTGKVAGRDEYERKGLGELSRDYNSVELEGDYIIFNPNQIKSADPVTRDEAGNVIPLSQRFNPSRDEITYSLRSGDFSSRMAAAFSPFQRSPELRRLMGKLAHERVMRLAADLIDKANVIRKAGDLEREARTREAVKADELTKSGMKEADARKEAKRQVSEWLANARKESGSAKAQRDRLKAWLRTLDAILSAAPAEVRAKVGGYIKLAGLATDEAMLKEIENRIAKLDVELSKWLKKEYLEQIAKLFKRFAPKKDDKGRITSSITAEAAEDIGFAFEFASLDDANQEKEMVALEKTLEESEDAAEIQDAIGKLAIANLFHKLEEREASELEAAALWLEELGSGAREARKIIDAARAEWVKEAKDAAKADAANGRLSSLPDAENVEADARSSTFKRFTNDVKGFLNSALFTMGQQLEIVFGQDSRITTEFHRRAVRAANDSTDIKRDIEARREAFVADLFGTSSRIKQAGRMGALTVPSASGVVVEAGGKTKTIDVPADVVLRIIEGTADLKALGFTKDEAATLADAWADNNALPVKRQKRVFQIERRGEGKDVELTMSQDEAIQYLLWSNQKASREQMERDGWSKESFQQLNAFLSDDARALAKFFADEYARMGRLIEPVYRRMFNAPFPQVDNYSPIFRDISKADSIIDIDQQGHGSGVSSGFILARNKNARSALRRTSAISAFMQHTQSAAHWITHVELVRDLRSVLIDKEVQNAIRSNGRTAAANGIKKRVMQLENQGKVGAAGIAELDSWGSRLLQARAFKGLAWRISPVMKQASAYFNPLLADVPAWDYMRGTARLLSGQLDVSAMWNSPDIQRRIESGFSAEARIAMDKLGYTGSTLLAAMGKGMLPMQLVDAGWTTAGAAVAFDYYRRNNIKSGMNETLVESAALDQLEMMIAESAQPADPANRSLIEGLQNPWLKSMWMFASEHRKTLAVEIMALRRLATGKSKNKAMDVQRAVVAHVVMATTTQLMAGILSLLMGDDDDREREWSVEEWASAIVAGPINGLFLFGDAFNYIGRRLFGLHAFEPSTAFGQAVKTVSYAPSNLDKVINGEPEEQRKAFLRLSEALGQAAAIVGPGNPFTAADVILGNPLKDAEKILSRIEE